MGTKRPDVVRRPPIEAGALTIGEMKAAGWTIRSYCPVCRTRLWVAPDDIIKVHGDLFFWGRSTACSVWTWGDYERCQGRLVYEARSIGGGSWVPLVLTACARDLWLLRQGRGPLAAVSDVLPS